MRFIGNKELIKSEIKDLLQGLGLTGKGLTVFDGFCGSGAVSDSLKDSFKLVSNDMLKWCVIYTRGRIHAHECTFLTLNLDPFEHFNSNHETSKGYIFNNYSLGGSNRMYFSEYNASRIDYFRLTIEQWKVDNLITENEYAYLLASLIESISFVSNTAGVYGAFLKHWDPRALKPIEFKRVLSSDSQSIETTYINSKLEDIISEVECDILYLDPPYTQNQYGTQYHLLETLILNDNPTISNVTGSRPTAPMRSDWSKDFKTHILFDKVLAKTKAKYIVFSYSVDGFMSKSFIEASMKRYGKADTFICKKLDYKKYSNFKSRDNHNHFEYLFFIERKTEGEITYESPLNYTGSKAKMATLINGHAPKNYRTFVDAFGGGFNVGININASRIIYNDINHFVSDLVSSFKKENTYDYILYLKRIIRKFGLEPKNAESYANVRDYYNSFPPKKRDPKLLYAVILYGFNQQIRFNGNHDFNNPVGMRWFNDKMLEKMISFARVIKEKNVFFESKNYLDISHEIDENTFTYFDPPYMLTKGSYNDGKRGFHGWNVDSEIDFFKFIDSLNTNRKPVMISYVSEHKGKQNFHIDEWINKGGYNLIQVDPSLGNSRKEIIITNYYNYADTTFYNKEQISETI